MRIDLLSRATSCADALRNPASSTASNHSAILRSAKRTRAMYNSSVGELRANTVSAAASRTAPATGSSLCHAGRKGRTLPAGVTGSPRF